jgi:hypothetical protein
MITQTGKLKYGIEVDGVTHTDFELRLPTIGDNIDAVEQVGATSSLKVHLAMMARTLMRLGTLPAEQVTYELLLQNLVDDDFDVLVAQEMELKKKRIELNQPSKDSASPLPSSPGSASTNPASAT